ncbi:MAG: hypothetical protein JOY54_20645 [Acidobacteriaceae bacterium]|nr:hypothetical protein [Acidobacteriaceae bacterium]
MSDPDQSSKSEAQRSMIGLCTALILYAVLIGVSFAALKGTGLVLALLIVGALAAKSIVHYLRNRIE